MLPVEYLTLLLIVTSVLKLQLVSDSFTLSLIVKILSFTCRLLLSISPYRIPAKVALVAYKSPFLLTLNLADVLFS